MIKINPGEFRNLISIEKSIVTTDIDNIPVNEWTVIHQCRAKILNISGKEVALSQGEVFRDTKRFIIRYPRSVEITNSDRIVYNNKYYQIKYPSDIQERKEYLEIVAEVIL
ncbi:MAG: phage head closure protein [Cetobacterium sp.]